MNPVTGSIIRNVALIVGAYLATHYGVEQTTVDAAMNGVIAIGGAVAAGGAAIWSLVRAIKLHKSNKVV